MMTIRSTSDPKLFGRYDELVRLLLGFILTTLIGGLLAYFYQERSEKASVDAQFHQYELSQATQTFSDISHILDTRLYRTRRFNWLEQGLSPPQETIADRQKYEDVRDEWNENLNRNYVLTERYFGSKLRLRLEKEIAKYFIAINCELSKPKPNFERVDREIETVNPMIYAFNDEMLEALQTGKIGATRDMSKYSDSPKAAQPPDCKE